MENSGESAPGKARPQARGTDPGDIRNFSPGALPMLHKALDEIVWLTGRGYPSGPTVAFVGNRYQLTARQRLALARSACSDGQLSARRRKMLPPEELCRGSLLIDGFNLIILLEVALSGGPLIEGRDGALRDLAGLRGTYHPIGKTEAALSLLGRFFTRHRVPGASFLLGAPVSNSGRLKARILEHAGGWSIPVSVRVVQDPDGELFGRARIVTADAAVLDRCESWFNLAVLLQREYIPEANVLSFTGG